MLLFGLTGGIATGKSTVTQMLRELGLPVIDADALAREVVEPGRPALAEIEARFPGVVENGVLNRALLYGLLSVAVVAAYVLVVGYLSLLFRGSDNIWIAMVATGLIAAAFQPLRERLQRLVNQLLYGQRDEPGAAVVALGARLQQSLAPAAVMPDDVAPAQLARVLGVRDLVVSPAVSRDAGSIWLLGPRVVRVGRNSS